MPSNATLGNQQADSGVVAVYRITVSLAMIQSKAIFLKPELLHLFILITHLQDPHNSNRS